MGNDTKRQCQESVPLLRHATELVVPDLHSPDPIERIRARLAFQRGSLALARLRGNARLERSCSHWCDLIERELEEALAAKAEVGK